MANEQDFTDEMTGGETAELEKLLASFVPRAAGTNTAQLLFRAGREAAAAELSRRGGVGRWLWPCATAAATIAAATFAVLLAMRHEPAVRIVEKPVPVLTPAPVAVPEIDADKQPADNPSSDEDRRGNSDDSRVVPPPVSQTVRTLTAVSPNRGSYLRTRDLVLKHGFEAIPSFAPTHGVVRDQTVSIHELRKSILPRGTVPQSDSPRTKSIWPSFLLDGENL